MRPTIRHAALSAFLALGLASGAYAQAQTQDDHRGPRQAAGDMQGRMQAMREAHERQRAQDLRTILRLRPDQEPALTAFLQSHRPPMKPSERRGPPTADAAAMTTPQRLDEMARREADRTAMEKRRGDAVRAFYAALAADQRPVFDALQRMQGGGHERGGWGRRGFGGPGRGWGGPMPGRPSPRD